MVIKDLLEAAKRRLGMSSEPPEDLEQSPREHIRLSNPWHCVSIIPGPKRCEAVTKMLGERFLSTKAPLLPLKDCTEPNCSCRYKHHDDRRLEGVALDRNGMPLANPKRRSSD
jgi:hypothetical protein